MKNLNNGEIKMSKERLIAFYDAVLAIIMTILVLELEKPNEMTLRGFLELKESFFAYTLSFFWLGAIWVNHYNLWMEVEKISVKTVWSTMFLLFIASFFPYATAIISKNFYSVIAQSFYGLIIIGVTIVVIFNADTLIKVDEDNKSLTEKIKKRELLLKYDLVVKIVAFLISAFFYPPAMMIGLVITTLFVLFVSQKIIKA